MYWEKGLLRGGMVNNGIERKGSPIFKIMLGGARLVLVAVWWWEF